VDNAAVRRRLKLAAAAKVLDITQPMIALLVSAYVSLMLSKGEFFNVFLNILVLEFVTTVDSAIVDNLLETRRFAGKPVAVAVYFHPDEAFENDDDDDDDAPHIDYLYPPHPDEWETRSLGQEEVLKRLRDTSSTNAQKWTLLTDVERGLGLGERFTMKTPWYGGKGRSPKMPVCKAHVQLSRVHWDGVEVSSTAGSDELTKRWLSGMSYEAFREQLTRQQRLALPTIELIPSLQTVLSTTRSGIELELSDELSFADVTTLSADPSQPLIPPVVLHYLGVANPNEGYIHHMASDIKLLCMAKLLSACHALERLTVRTDMAYGADAPLFNDQLCEALGRHCPALTYLNVGCQRPGKKGMTRGTANEALTDRGLHALARCSKLLVVDLQGCRGFTDAGLTVLLERCPNLATLKLNYTKVTCDIIRPCIAAAALERVEVYKTGLSYRELLRMTKMGKNSDGRQVARRTIFDFDPYSYMIEEE